MEQFECIYEKYYRKVYLFLVKLSGDASLAEELTQETLYKAFLHMDQYEGRSSVYTWLCKIARNNWFTEMNRRGKQAEPESTGEAVSGYDLEQDAEKRLLLDALRQEILNLPEPYGSVCVLRIYGELSYREISASYDKSESWAKVTYFRGKTMLTERMKKYR